MEDGGNILGTAGVVCFAAMLCIPYVGIGPLLIVLAAMYAAVIAARLLTNRAG